MTEPIFRYEYKYVCSQAQIALLKSRIGGIMDRDIHLKINGQYHVRSLYFDNMNHRYYYDNENGTEPREKYRIRIYNKSRDYIILEHKRKVHGRVQKNACRISEQTCRTLMAGLSPPLEEDSPALLRTLCSMIQTQRLRPAVIVDYDRLPYVHRLGNVRVTFDQNICASNEISRFLESRIVKRPVMPTGRHLMEVKWDVLLPDYIKRSLQSENLRRTAFSKYYLCKRYDLSGGMFL